MIEELKQNVGAGINIISELSTYAENVDPDSQAQIENYITSLLSQLSQINNSIPYLIDNISIQSNQSKQTIAQPEISSSEIKKLRKKNLKKTKEKKPKRASIYGKLSNKIFLQTAQKFVSSGNFRNLTLDVKRSNLNILAVTYISMMFFSTFLSFFIAIAIFAFFLFFSFELSLPFISLFEGNYLSRFARIFWILIAVPLLTFLGFYFYPGTEKKSKAKKIEQELPFAVVHMGSIAGSGIEPVEIFRILSVSKEYKNAALEIKKIINQTEIYGYDLSTALRNVARSTPSSKLSELLNGMSITINSGGDIKSFFEKRAESLLLEYRIEREKFTKNAETFMDIYISVVISTPMILLLLLIMISVSGLNIGVGVSALAIAIIGIVAIVNIVFLAILHIRQPTY